MSETMLLNAGRTSEQGTTLNKGKLKPEYQEVTTTVEMGPEDMARLGIQDGDRLRLSNDAGETFVVCRATKPGFLPSGMLFMAYGPASSQLMESDTAGSGMPLSKNLHVRVDRVAAASPAAAPAAAPGE